MDWCRFMATAARVVVLLLILSLLWICVTGTLVPAASASPASVVSSGAMADSTDSGGRPLARGGDGTIHCVYVKSNGTSIQVFYSRSNDSGVTWYEEQVSFTSTSTANQTSPSVAVDSANNVHVVWTGLGWGSHVSVSNIQYRMRNASGWQPQVAITDSSAAQTYPSVTVDSFDNVHIVWVGLGWGSHPGFRNVEYSEKTSAGEWTPQTGVTDAGANQDSPSVAADSFGNVHVVWAGMGWQPYPDAGSDIEYVQKSAAGNWTQREAVCDNLDDQIQPSMAIDSHGYVHVVWSGYGSTQAAGPLLQYRERTQSGWGVWTGSDWSNNTLLLTLGDYSIFHASVAVDSKDIVHFAWAATGWGNYTGSVNVVYRPLIPQGASLYTVLTDVPYDHYHPIFMSSASPNGSAQTGFPYSGYALMYTTQTSSGYMVMFRTSSTLRWAPPTFTSLQISASPGIVTQTAYSFSTITATASDEFGSAMANVSVSFNVSSPGVMTPTSRTTGSDGKAASALRLSLNITSPVTVRVTAASGNISSASLPVTFMPYVEVPEFPGPMVSFTIIIGTMSVLLIERNLGRQRRLV
jgi:hypothetical protein